MADYFTHFSCLLDVGTPANAARALEIYDALSDENVAEDPPSDGFMLSISGQAMTPTPMAADDQATSSRKSRRVPSWATSSRPAA